LKDYSFVVKLTNSCNMNCGYCYHRKNLTEHTESRMSEETLRRTIECLIDHNHDYAHFIWHGGEPLLLGLDYFQRIMDLEAQYAKPGMSLSNSVQTNGTMLSDEWIDFFVKHDFHVGISLDGFHELHQFNRDLDDQTFDVIVEYIRKLKEKGARFGVLSVVSQRTLGNEERLFDFFCEAGIENVGFLPMNYGNAEDSLSAADYGKFLKRYFEIWIFKGKLGLSIREFDEFLRGHCGVVQRLCVHCNDCDIYYTVTPTGDIYPCDCFPQLPESRLGTVFDNLKTVHKNVLTFLRGSETLPKPCTGCKFKAICGGGCKYYRWLHNQDYTEPQLYCASYKTLYQTMERCLSQ